jgi:hypothetical protein
MNRESRDLQKELQVWLIPDLARIAVSYAVEELQYLDLKVQTRDGQREIHMITQDPEKIMYNIKDWSHCHLGYLRTGNPDDKSSFDLYVRDVKSGDIVHQLNILPHLIITNVITEVKYQCVMMDESDPFSAEIQPRITHPFNNYRCDFSYSDEIEKWIEKNYHPGKTVKWVKLYEEWGKENIDFDVFNPNDTIDGEITHHGYARLDWAIDVVKWEYHKLWSE